MSTYMAATDTVIMDRAYAAGDAVDVSTWDRRQLLLYLDNGILYRSDINATDWAGQLTASTLSQLSDVNVAAPNVGDGLVWDGTKWTPTVISSDSGNVAVTNSAISSNTVYARRVNGQVSITGVWVATSTGTITTAFQTLCTLPAGMAPLQTQRILVLSTCNGTIPYVLDSTVAAITGTVQIRAAATVSFTSGSTTFSLNGHTWRAD